MARLVIIVNVLREEYNAEGNVIAFTRINQFQGGELMRATTGDTIVLAPR